jgi:C1A family cysteine protease
MGEATGGRQLRGIDYTTTKSGMLGKAHRATTVDWAYDGKMVDVKDQGSCGSCWSFAALTALEGTIAVKTGKDPVHLSEQQIVDCTLSSNPKNKQQFGKDYRGHGCSGGWMSFAWDFVKDQGAMTDADYPYNAKENACAHKADATVANVKEYGRI